MILKIESRVTRDRYLSAPQFRILLGSFSSSCFRKGPRSRVLMARRSARKTGVLPRRRLRYSRRLSFAARLWELKLIWGRAVLLRATYCILLSGVTALRLAAVPSVRQYLRVSGVLMRA